MKSSSFSAKRVAVWGMGCALTGALSFIESWLPAMPVPGARWGLANIVIILFLSVQGLPAALAMAVVKAGFALLRGGTAALFSLVGGLLSVLVMTAVSRGRQGRHDGHFGWLGIGMSGALAHNAGQLLVAWWLTTSAIVYYVPFMAIISLVTGALTGLTARAVAPTLIKHLPPFGK